MPGPVRNHSTTCTAASRSRTRDDDANIGAADRSRPVLGGVPLAGSNRSWRSRIMGMDMMWWMPGMMLIDAFVWLLILVGIGLGIWWLVREFRPTRRDQALQLLRERYARGEIDREEFDARRALGPVVRLRTSSDRGSRCSRAPRRWPSPPGSGPRLGPSRCRGSPSTRARPEGVATSGWITCDSTGSR